MKTQKSASLYNIWGNLSYIDFSLPDRGCRYHYPGASDYSLETRGHLSARSKDNTLYHNNTFTLFYAIFSIFYFFTAGDKGSLKRLIFA